nr:MAG TPA: Type I restriction enzyme Methylase [Caudoviricetes sp.]
MSIISDSMLRNNDNDRASAQYASSHPYSQTYSDEGSSSDNQQGLLERIFNGLGAASDWIGNNVEYVENSPVGQWIGNKVEYVENSPVGQAVGQVGQVLAPANSIFRNWPALLGLAANAAVTPKDNDTFSGSLYDAGVNGAANTVGSIADLMHQDDLAAAMYTLANKTQDNTPVQADWDWDYITNPHGLTRSFGNAIGSMAPLLPAAALAPESLVAAAGRLSPWLANGVRYGFTAIPEAMAEGGQTRREAIEDGLNHPDLRAFGTLAKNLPLLAVSNTLEGAILGGGLGKMLAGKAGESVLSRMAKAPFRATPSALAEGLQNGFEEGLQQGIQNASVDKEYGYLPWNWTNDQWDAAREGFFGTLPLGGIGGARKAIFPSVGDVAGTPDNGPDNTDPVVMAQLTGKNDDVPTADGVDVTNLDPQQYTQWYGEKLKSQGIDVPDATITVQTPKATGTTGGAKAGAGANVMDVAQDFMGQHMENGANGCVEAVTKIGARYSPFLADELSKGVVNVDTLVADAGDKVIPFDPNNLEAGDVIVYGDNDHVVLADGNGGYVGNSSSQQKVVQGGNYNEMGDLKPTKIIKTGNGVTAQNETANNGGASAADLSSLPVGDIATAIAQNTGLPADFIWAQLSHESDGGNSKLAREDHNYGGVKGNDGEYLHFDNDQQFIDYMSDYYPKYREDGIYDAKTADQFAEALQHGGYFTAGIDEYEGGMHRYLEQAGLSDSGTAGAPSEKQSNANTMTAKQFGDMLDEKMIDFAGTNDDTVRTVFNDMSTSKDKALVALFAPYMQDGVFANTAANRAALANDDGFKKAMSMFLSKHLSDYAPAFENGRISFQQAEDALRPRHQVQAAQTAQAPNIQTAASPKMEAAAIQNVLSSFAQDKKNVARTEQEANLFDDMLDADDHFIDTPKNRQTLLKNYGAQLQNYVDDVMTPSLDDRVNQAIEQAVQNKDLNRMNILTQAKQANDTATLEKLVGPQTKQHVDIAAMLTPANTDVKNHVSSMMQGNALVHQTATMEHQAPQNEVASTVQGNTPVQQAPATGNEMPQGKVAPTIQANIPANQAPARMDNRQATQQSAPKEQAGVTPLPTQEAQQTIDEQNAQTDARIAEIKKTPLAQRKALGQQYLDTLRQNNVPFSEKKLAKSLMNGDPEAIEHVQRTYGDLLNTITPAEAAAASQHAPRTIQAATTARLGNMVSEITSGNTYKNASPVGKLAYLSAASAHAKTVGADKSARAIDSIIADVRKKAGFSGKGTTEGMTPEQKDEFYNAFYKQSLDDAMAIRKEAADEKPANLKSLDNTIEMFKQELANSKPTKEERKEVAHESTQSKSQNEPDKGTKNQDQHAKPEPRKTADTQREAEESEVSTTKKAADNGGKYVLADGYRTESGKPLLESGENEFILKPNGSKDFGEITDAISKAAKEQSGVDLAPGKIRLRVGNDKEGLLHAKKHEEQANAAGYDSTENMVADIAESFDEIYMREPVGSKTKPTFVLVKHNDRQSGKKNGIAPAYFELKQGADGNFYIVVTAIPMRDRSLKSATKKDRLIYSSPALDAASTSSSSTVSRPRSDNAGATKGVRPTSDKSSGLSTHIIPHEQKEGTKNLDTGNHHEMVEKHSQNGDTVDVVLEAQRDGVPSNLADYVRDVTREDVASIPDKRKKFIDEAIDTGAFRAIETDRGGYMLIGTKGGMFSSVTELTPAETVYYAMHGGLDFNKRSTKEAIMDDLATWYGSEKSREIKSSKANHDSEKGKNLDSTGMVTTERTSKEAADEGWQESKDETKLSAAEEQAPSGTSDEAKQVYTIVRDQLTTSKSKGAQCAASVGAAILAHHADVYAKAYSKATGKKYTAMDYLNEKFGLNMTGQPIEGRAFNQAMSKSKATSLAEFAQIATSGEVDPNGKKKTFYSVNATNDIRVDFPIDDTRHSVNKHNLTGQQLQAIEDNLENIVSAYQDTKKKGHYGGLPVLAHIVTPIGDAGITFEFSPYGRVFVTTMFFDTKQNIENWAQKNGASRSLADDKSASSFTGHPLSISTIQQKLGIGNEKVYNQTAWHGSPYDFDRFDLGAIGTGEGAQVHGWGLYFAANREVSEAYKDALSRDVVEQKHYLYLAGNKYEYPDGMTLIRADNGKVSSNPILSDVAKLIHNLGSIDAAVTRLEKLKQGYETRGNTGRSYQHVLDALKVLNDDKTYEKYEDQKRSTARLYQVDIPDADTMLDEDKPLSEQPKIMQLLDAHAEKTGDWSFSSEELDESDTGRDFYKYLEEALHSPREASKYLNAAGINGITYNGGRDGRCYVVFDDEAVSVINKYNQMVNGKVQGETAPLENGRRVVSLFEHADESTFLHEMGHVFLLDLQDLAEVDQTAANDMAAVEGWTTWKKGQAKEYKGTAWEQEFADRENAIVKAMADGDEETVNQLKDEWAQERFARGLERYLESGEAPSSKLKDVFEKFKQFLTHIYNAFKGEGGKPSEDVQNVMARMMDSDVENTVKVPPMGKAIIGRTGKETTVTTDSGKTIRVRYRLVPTARVITSHNAETMAANKAYPQELQPRDRQRVSMQEQVTTMANELRPADLGAGRNLNQGAPIIRKDGVVLNGNGRAMAIQKATTAGGDKATAYRKYIFEHSKEFGISRSNLSQMRKYMLVREVVDDIDTDTMQDIIGSTAGGSRMGASEQAKADAKKIRPRDLERYVDNEQGDLTTAANRDFVAGVLYRIVGKNERNAYTDEHGNVNADGIQRVKRALFSLAYNDNGLIDKMAESTDDNIRNVSRGLMSAAPAFARVNLAVKDGQAYEYDAAKTISDAVKHLDALRREGKPVKDYLNEQSMFSEYQDTDEVREVLRFLDENKRSGKKIGIFLNDMARSILEQGSPNQTSLMDGGRATLGEIIKAAERVARDGTTAASLFGNEEGSHVDVARSKASVQGDLKKIGKRVVFLPDNSLTSREKGIKEFGEKMGLKVVFFEGPSNLHGMYENGVSFINRSSSTSAPWTFWHETFHWLRHNNPELYRQMVSYIGKKQAFSSEQLQAYRDKTGRQALSDADVIEEMLADAMPDVHKRVSLFRNLGKADAPLLQRFVGWLRDAMRAFHDALTGRKAGLSETQKAAMRDALANIAADLRDSNGKHIFKVSGAEREITAADGTKLSYPARFSGKQETPTIFTAEDRLKADKKAWKGTLRKAWKGDMPDTTMLPVMQTPLVLKLVGAPDYPIVMRQSKLMKIKKDHPEVTKAILNELPSYLADPMIIFKSSTVSGRLVVGTELEDASGANIIVPIELNSKDGRMDVNVITSVYGKGTQQSGTNIAWFVNNIQAGNAVYINKKQAADFYQSAGLQLPMEGRRFNDLFGSSIKTDADLVKSRRENLVRYSLDANDNSTPSLFTRAYNHLTGRKDAASHDKNVKAMLEDITKMRIRFGKLDPATEIVFKKFEGVIRARNANEWEKVLPEAGRAIADRLNLKPSEDMNNYIAKWLLDEATNDTSQEASDFAAALKNDPVLSDQLVDLKTLFNERNNREADEVVRDAIQYEKPKERTTLTKAWETFYDEMIEELGPVKRMVKRVQEKSGQELAASVNPYIALRLFRGNAGRAMTMIEGQSEAAVKALQTNYPGVNFNGFKTLHMILDECGALHNEKRMKDFLAFALACHVKDIHTLNNRIRKSQQRLRDKIADLNDKINNLPEYQQLIESDKKVDDKYQEQREAYQKEIEGYQAKIDKAEKTIMEVPRTEDGLSLTEDRCNKVMMKYMKEYGEAQQDLVHFSKVTTSILYNAGVISKKRYKELQERWPNYIPMFRVFEDNEEVDFGDSLKPMHGSTRRIINPLDSIIRNTYDFVKKAERNKARQLLADLTRISDVGEYIEEVDNAKPNDKTTITFYENGERKYLQTDPDIVKAVNNMGREESNWVLRLLHGPAKIARACFTTINPSFALRNLIRDSTDATIYSKYGFKPWDFVRGFLHAVHRDELFYEWLSSGAAQASAISLDRDYTQATLNQMSKTWKERLLSKEFLPAILEGMQMVGEYSEYGTRIAAYERVKKTLAGENGPHPAAYDLVSAAFESRDLMDFARGGRGSRYLNNVVVFANASIQGFDKFFRTFDFRKPYRKESMKALARLFLCGMLPALLLAGIHSGDDWWEELPDWQKETNWILGKVGNTIIRIPKGQDIGLRFFSNLIEKAMDRSKHKAGDYFKPVWDSLPDMIPTALLPIIEATANHSYFTGAPVVPKYQEKLPAYLQFGNETSSFAKFVGKVIGVSPRKVEHVLFGYTGNMGKGLLGVYDTIVGNQSLNTNLNEAPVISGFTAIPYKQSKTVNDFYDKFDEQQRLNEEFKLTKKKPDGYDPSLYKRMTKAQQELSKINKQERAAIDDPKMDSGVREQKQLGYQQQRLSVVRRVMGH